MTATATKAKPILFSAPMVLAILDGRKTQTRRIINPQLGPEAYFSDFEGGYVASGLIGDIPKEFRSGIIRCPYGTVGSELWVRETWATDLHCEQDSPAAIARAAMEAGYTVDAKHPAAAIWYASDSSVRRWGDFHDVQGRWRPSIHMPRWASRITLRITGIRVERVQDITEEDAKAEGVEPDKATDHPQGVYYTAFRDIWHKINGPESWAANPWVWVVSFERVGQ